VRAKIITATAKDNELTPAVNETVNAVVTTGAGADVIHVATTGKGTTTVNTGAGKDTIYVTNAGIGVASINAGADDDTVFVNLSVLGASPNLTIDGGAGTDTLVMNGQASYSAVDYLRMNTALSNFEAVRFDTGVGTTTALDVSKLDIGNVTALTFNANSKVTEVAGQTLTLAAKAGVTKIEGVVDTVTAGTAAPTAFNATAAGYKLGTNAASGVAAVETVYGGALTVSTTGTVALTLAGSAATVNVTATGGTTATTVSPTATLTGSDVGSLTVNLTSRLNTADKDTGAATVAVASFDTGAIRSEERRVGKEC
jgi:hypothetical protein